MCPLTLRNGDEDRDLTFMHSSWHGRSIKLQAPDLPGCGAQDREACMALMTSSESSISMYRKMGKPKWLMVSCLWMGTITLEPLVFSKEAISLCRIATRNFFLKRAEVLP